MKLSMKMKFVLIIVGFVVFFIWQNNDVVITKYTYANSNLPDSFDGYKIVQISDLHNKNFYGRLSDKIKKLKPDIIVITGDLIDRRNTKIDTALEFVKRAVDIAPVYYVSGNHEHLSGKYNMLKQELERLNVNIIDNSKVILEQGDNKIGLVGIADPAAYQNEDTYLWADNSYYIKNSLSKLLGNTDTRFNILLSHRPELFDIYVDMGIDLVFSGHAHGGQFRIPFMGGLVAPNQGFFPKYTEGMYTEGSTSMVVSRGLGNSIIPIRVFNRPELVTVILRKRG